MSNSIQGNYSYGSAVRFLNELDAVSQTKDAQVGQLGLINGKIVTRCKNEAGCEALRQRLLQSLDSITKRQSETLAADEFAAGSMKLAGIRKELSGKQLTDRAFAHRICTSVDNWAYQGEGIRVEEGLKLDGWGVNEFTDEEIAAARQATHAERAERYRAITDPAKRMMAVTVDKVADDIMKTYAAFAKYEAALAVSTKKNRPTLNVGSFGTNDPDQCRKFIADYRKCFGPDRESVCRKVDEMLTKEVADEKDKRLANTLKPGWTDQTCKAFEDNLAGDLLDSFRVCTKASGNKQSGLAYEFFRSNTGGNSIAHAKLNGQPLIQYWPRPFTPKFVKSDRFKEQFDPPGQNLKYEFSGGVHFVDEKGENLPPNHPENNSIYSVEMGRCIQALVESLPDDGGDYRNVLLFLTTALSMYNPISVRQSDVTGDLGFGSMEERIGIDGKFSFADTHDEVKTDITVDRKAGTLKIVQTKRIPSNQLCSIGKFQLSKGGVALNEADVTCTMTIPLAENKGVEVGTVPRGLQYKVDVTPVDYTV